MSTYTQFNAVFPTSGVSPYDAQGVSEIDVFRKNFRGTLFIDRILGTLGIRDGRKLYPPRGETGLRSLHQHICDATISTQSKLSVLYYILLDFDEVRGPQQARLADEFARHADLTKKFSTLMRGLWHMDRTQFKFALEYLAHPSLPCEFADEIIGVLVTHSDPTDYSLPLAYYHAKQPVMRSPEALDLLFGAIARTSIAEALFFSRQQPEPTRQLLFRKLVASIVDHETTGRRAKELVSLPLDGHEDAWMHEYLMSGDAEAVKMAKPVLEMRHLVTGQQRGPVTSKGVGELR